METLAIAGVILIPLIIGLIQFAKRLLPGVTGEAWLGVSMGLGIVGQVVARLIEVGLPNDLAGWTGLVVLGLAYGLATSKVYDETKQTPME